jgi:hypothetical protein
MKEIPEKSSVSPGHRRLGAAFHSAPTLSPLRFGHKASLVPAKEHKRGQSSKELGGRCRRVTEQSLCVISGYVWKCLSLLARGRYRFRRIAQESGKAHSFLSGEAGEEAEMSPELLALGKTVSDSLI